MKIDKLSIAPALTYLVGAGLIIGVAFATDTNTVPASTNLPPMNIVITNNVVRFNGKVIGNVNGTNFVAVPDVAGLSASHDTGFALGVRYGALASRRNPDVAEWNALITIAKSLMPK